MLIIGELLELRIIEGMTIVELRAANTDFHIQAAALFVGVNREGSGFGLEHDDLGVVNRVAEKIGGSLRGGLDVLHPPGVLGDHNVEQGRLGRRIVSLLGPTLLRIHLDRDLGKGVVGFGRRELLVAEGGGGRFGAAAQ
jgi:hypothetical protein